MTRIKKSSTTDCAFSVAIDFAEHYLERAFVLPVGNFRLVPDTSDPARFHRALHIECPLQRGAENATFFGTLSARPHFNGSTLTLEGFCKTSSPREFYDESAGSFLHDIVASIDAEWQQFIRRSPSIVTLNRRNERVGSYAHGVGVSSYRSKRITAPRSG